MKDEIRSDANGWSAICASGFATKLLAPDMHRFVSDAAWAELEALPGWCRCEKAEALVRLVRWSAIASVVEIGVWGGRSFEALARGLAGREHVSLVGIDPYDPSFCGPDAETVLAALAARLRTEWPGAMLLRCASTAIVQLGRPVDLVHVDGNHTHPAPLDDVQAWYPRVRRYGYVVMDDAHYPGVRPANEWLEAHGAELLVDVKYDDIDPAANAYGGWRLYQKTGIA